MSVFSQFQIWPVKSEAGSLLANGKVVVAGTLKVNFRVMKGPKGNFAAFPSDRVEKEGKTEFYPQASLLDETTKELFQTEAMKAYNEALAAGPQATAKPGSPKPSANVPF